MNLLTVSNKKLLKSNDTPYLSIGLHLLPHTLGDGFTNLCKFSTKFCRLTCLIFSGKGSLSKVHESRKRKTLMYLNDKVNFLNQINAEVSYYRIIASNNNKTLTVRLNLTSDIDWSLELIGGKTFFELYPDVIFYDYTKDYAKKSNFNNYHLIYSYDSVNHKKAMSVLERGDSLAVVFNKQLPKTFEGYPVKNGDADDLIFRHSKNSVLGLLYKNVIIPGKKNVDLIKNSTLVVKNHLI